MTALADTTVPALYMLSAEEAQRITARLGSLLTLPHAQRDEAEQSILFLADWLKHLDLFDESVIMDILHWAGPDMFLRMNPDDTTSWAGAETRLGPTCVVVDERYVSFQRLPAYLDTKTLREVSELPQPPVTYIMCDLLALRHRMLGRISRLLPKASA